MLTVASVVKVSVLPAHGRQNCSLPDEKVSNSGMTAPVGHFSRDCPQDGGGKRACHNCGSEDHLARECPDKADKGNDFYAKGPEPAANDCKFPLNSQVFPFRHGVLTLSHSRSQ